MVGLESVEEARQKNLRDFFFPEDQPKVMEEFVPAVLERGHGEMEVRFRNFKTGQGRWMVYKVLKLSDAAGRTMAMGTVSHDVTGRKMLEDSLRKVAADLSEANRRKNEFLATLSHELRNPLAPLTHMLEVLKRGGEQPELRERAVETMKRQLGQLGPAGRRPPGPQPHHPQPHRAAQGAGGAVHGDAPGGGSLAPPGRRGRA
jgi:PAS domain S-box-containing protein